MYKKILVAVNEHINSEVTGRYALHFCKSCGAKFYTCFIAEKGAPAESLNRAQEAMKRLLLEAEKLEVPVESLTRTGEAVQEIDAVVRREGIDIVFAATRREDLDQAVLRRHRGPPPLPEAALFGRADAGGPFREGLSPEDPGPAEGHDRSYCGARPFCRLHGQGFRLQGLCLSYAPAG